MNSIRYLDRLLLDFGRYHVVQVVLEHRVRGVFQAEGRDRRYGGWAGCLFRSLSLWVCGLFFFRGRVLRPVLGILKAKWIMQSAPGPFRPVSSFVTVSKFVPKCLIGIAGY